MTKNVGAKNETDAGKYFAWGMKEGYYANQIKDDMFTNDWYKQQEIVNWNGYQFEDGSYAPSKEQIKELIDNCKYEFITYNGVKGGMFTSKINDNSIFLSAAGYGGEGSLDDVGFYGGFWLSSLYGSNPGSAWDLSFNCGGADCYYGSRYYGRSVRGVVAASTNVSDAVTDAVKAIINHSLLS